MSLLNAGLPDAINARMIRIFERLDQLIEEYVDDIIFDVMNRITQPDTYAKIKYLNESYTYQIYIFVHQNNPETIEKKVGARIKIKNVNKIDKQHLITNIRKSIDSDVQRRKYSYDRIVGFTQKQIIDYTNDLQKCKIQNDLLNL